MKTALITLAVCAAYLLTACGGGSDGIDENGKCRVDGKLVPAQQCV
jgi:major membrane immunogen (membrane-anchored lipoprotein)